MGIGVSYTGHGGKRRDFSLEGVPKPGEAADRLLGDTTSRVREALAMIPQHREKERGADGVKVHPRGSVKDSQEGICLKGEEFRPPKDDEIYSVVKGERGFHRLKDIDPAGQAARLGDTGVGGDSADSNKAGEDDAVIWQTLTRLAQETDNQGGLWLCQYERDICKTKAGRVVSVSEERKTVVCELPQGGGGSTTVPGMALFAYDEATHTIAGGAYCFARRYFTVSGITVTAGGNYRLKVSMGTTRAAVVEQGDGFASPSSEYGFSKPSTDYAYVPLYTFDSNLRVTADWRGAPCVQAWE